MYILIIHFEMLSVIIDHFKSTCIYYNELDSILTDPP